MNKRVWLSLAMMAGVAGVTAWACGPDFPNQLLDRRDANLKATPRNSFAFEMAQLVPPAHRFPVREDGADYGAPDADAEARARGLTPAQWTRVKALRESDDGATALADGKDLPADLRAYTAGAVEYGLAQRSCAATPDDADAQMEAEQVHHCDPFATEAMDRALEYFQQVLALPSTESRMRSAWASFVVGRVHAQRAWAHAGDRARFASERDAAVAAFEATRRAVADGADDSQGLAAASYGEQARMWLIDRGQPCDWHGLMREAGCGPGIPPHDVKQAVALYAAQAALGSRGAVESLAAIAQNVLRDDTRAAALIDDPLTQRMLVAYALARSGSDPGDADAPESRATTARLAALVTAIQTQGISEVAGADRLAALAYRSGRFELAAQLAAKAQGPLARWVSAKLALRKGDLAAAATAYAEAARAFPKADDAQPTLQTENVSLLVGEQGVLSLARGEYLQAMAFFFDAAQRVGGDGNVYIEDASGGAGYGNDAMYIAERVLTIDELKGFVDAHAPASPAPKPAKAASTDQASYFVPTPLADNLRWLLARRLMRAGRYDDAIGYFPASGDARFGEIDFRAKARQFADAVRDGEHAWTRVAKAQARYAAAVIEREQGMELFGYEQGPDYSDNSGSFQGGSGHSANDLKQPLVTDGERERFARSVAQPDRRFHYRYLAADRAASAADMLPARSQAFAAVLCKATGWMLEGPPDYQDLYGGYGEPAPTQPPERLRRAQALYARYVKEGPYVDWAADFGRSCEEPDFGRARTLQWHLAAKDARQWLRAHAVVAAAVLVLLAGGLGLAWRRRRRRPA